MIYDPSAALEQGAESNIAFSSFSRKNFLLPCLLVKPSPYFSSHTATTLGNVVVASRSNFPLRRSFETSWIYFWLKSTVFPSRLVSCFANNFFNNFSRMHSEILPVRTSVYISFISRNRWRMVNRIDRTYVVVFRWHKIRRDIKKILL